MERLEKLEKTVTIRTSDGRTISGRVFLLSSERLSDFINQDNKFIPIESKNEIEIINKDHIVSILEVEKDIKVWHNNGGSFLCGHIKFSVLFHKLGHIFSGFCPNPFSLCLKRFLITSQMNFPWATDC